MSVRQRLKHRCTVQPRTKNSNALDGHNKWTWPNTYTNVRCLFYSYAQGRKEVEERQETVADFLNDFMPDQPVAEDDRVVFENVLYFVINVRPEYASNGKMSFKTAHLRKDPLVT